jgi:hypothetical protein
MGTDPGYADVNRRIHKSISGFIAYQLASNPPFTVDLHLLPGYQALWCSAQYVIVTPYFILPPLYRFPGKVYNKIKRVPIDFLKRSDLEILDTP